MERRVRAYMLCSSTISHRSYRCIMLELFTKKPVFQGADEIHQVHVVYKIMGTPTVDAWPGITSLPWYELLRTTEVIPNRFRELFKKYASQSSCLRHD